MPDTGVSTAAILTRRLQYPARAHTTNAQKPFEQFCQEQIERINRIADKQIRRVADARRAGGERQIRANGCELEVHVRGRAGSDAHPDVDPELRNV